MSFTDDQIKDILLAYPDMPPKDEAKLRNYSTLSGPRQTSFIGQYPAVAHFVEKTQRRGRTGRGRGRGRSSVLPATSRNAQSVQKSHEHTRIEPDGDGEGIDDDRDEDSKAVVKRKKGKKRKKKKKKKVKVSSAISFSDSEIPTESEEESSIDSDESSRRLTSSAGEESEEELEEESSSLDSSFSDESTHRLTPKKGRSSGRRRSSSRRNSSSRKRRPKHDSAEDDSDVFDFGSSLSPQSSSKRNRTTTKTRRKKRKKSTRRKRSKKSQTREPPRSKRKKRRASHQRQAPATPSHDSYGDVDFDEPVSEVIETRNLRRHVVESVSGASVRSHVVDGVSGAIVAEVDEEDEEDEEEGGESSSLDPDSGPSDQEELIDLPQGPTKFSPLLSNRNFSPENPTRSGPFNLIEAAPSHCPLCPEGRNKPEKPGRCLGGGGLCKSLYHPSCVRRRIPAEWRSDSGFFCRNCIRKKLICVECKREQERGAVLVCVLCRQRVHRSCVSSVVGERMPFHCRSCAGGKDIPWVEVGASQEQPPPPEEAFEFSDAVMEQIRRLGGKLTKPTRPMGIKDIGRLPFLVQRFSQIDWGQERKLFRECRCGWEFIWTSATRLPAEEMDYLFCKKFPAHVFIGQGNIMIGVPIRDPKTNELLGSDDFDVYYADCFGICLGPKKLSQFLSELDRDVLPEKQTPIEMGPLNRYHV